MYRRDRLIKSVILTPANTNPNTHSNIGRHLGISLSCILFSHLPLLGRTNMAADGFNKPIHSLRLMRFGIKSSSLKHNGENNILLAGAAFYRSKLVFMYVSITKGLDYH